MIKDNVNNLYFEWLYNSVCEKRFPKEVSYRKLLMYLHSIDFRYSITRDKNRAEDGVSLRYRFTYDADLYLDDPCSVLEMMIALAIRCEENIMDDPRFGNRTSQWFWGMIASLGLSNMTDDHFDKRFVSNVMERFLDREYEPNGKGGLFTIKNCDRDLRDIEIWIQLCWYLDSIT